MPSSSVVAEARSLKARLPSSPSVAVLGSTEFHHPMSGALCAARGHALAGVPRVLLLTGGVEGVGEAVGRAFHAALGPLRARDRVHHVLPVGAWDWDYGTTWYAGADMSERREILARLSGIYVVIEGGPGTEHEARVAREEGALVIPIACTGGHAAALHASLSPPADHDAGRWAALAQPHTHFEAAAAAVLAMVRERLAEAAGGS